jgi:hypothetical protein
MRRFLTGYAVSCNRRHRRHGPLFQNRCKSIVCEPATWRFGIGSLENLGGCE